ncbi:MAG: hypothetical protein R3B51_09580 [Thermodesulfobacteriota bacterium]
MPSVPTAVIFDIGIGKNIRPDAEMGYRACVNASYDGVEEGSVGAGTGATIGKPPASGTRRRAGSEQPPTNSTTVS